MRETGGPCPVLRPCLSFGSPGSAPLRAPSPADGAQHPLDTDTDVHEGELARPNQCERSLPLGPFPQATERTAGPRYRVRLAPCGTSAAARTRPDPCQR